MLISLLAATLSAATLQSAEPPEKPEEQIVVTGQANRQEQIRDFVKTLTRTYGTDPLARFDYKDACPEAVGLTPALDAAITARLRLVAKTAGMAVAKPGCAPNVLVMFAPDKTEMLKALRKDSPELFRSPAGPISVPEEQGPALAWYIEGRLDRSGLPVRYDRENGRYALETPVGPSRISAAMRPVLLGSVVIIEQDAVVGLTPTQVADYAAIRAFSRMEPAKLTTGGTPTILTVLSTPMGGSAPESLTRWDLGFLRGLYGSVPAHYAQRQRKEIEREVERTLQGGSSDRR